MRLYAQQVLFAEKLISADLSTEKVGSYDISLR